ncbi:MAG: DUF2017 family protein [Actinobacteria bacterium]|uniref:Unannotated protein n=1 Tax=freshwater metagenome TaxID=449393 RepID=A0A6J5ZCV7_9ZZZZ|nr:DUF2017 family protein [Actinomycetota bacterium]
MFRAIKANQVTLELEEVEVSLLKQLLDQLMELLEPFDIPSDTDPLEQLVGMSGPTQLPQDPALARLFPNAYVDDKEAASEFRQYTEPDLRKNKVDNVKLALETLVEWNEVATLDKNQARAWLLALNDLRLTLGTRIGIGNFFDNHNERNDPAFHLYDWLTYLQGTLVDAIASE